MQYNRIIDQKTSKELADFKGLKDSRMITDFIKKNQGKPRYS